MSQMPWRFLDAGKIQLEVDGVPYRRGYGFPGDPTKGEYNNCLIDSLRQCLDNLECDCKAVRRDLELEFDEALDNERRLVSRTSFLDIGYHWEAIMRSLLRHNTSHRSTAFNPEEYCIVGLDGNRPGHGVVFGRRNAPNRLVVVNWNDMHFDPCLRR